VADGGGDQVEAALVEAGDGIAEADGVPGGEAGRDSQDAFSPPDAGRSPVPRAVTTASQLIQAIGVPSLMLAAVSMWRVKSSRCRNVPWLMMSPVPASSGWMPAAAARSAVLSWLVTGALLLPGGR
jgi:hypothetical protein